MTTMRYQVMMDRIPVYVDSNMTKNELVSHFAQRGFDIDISAPMEFQGY